jgi:hypothetical protein
MRCVVRGLSLPLLAFALSSPARAAGPGDPLMTPACQQAMKALDAAERKAMENAPPGGDRQVPPELAAQRKKTAKACLGGRGDAPPPKEIAIPPVTVAPAEMPRPPAEAVRPPPPPPPPAQPPRPLVSVTSCDAGGCWASDGSRLNRVGGVLLGPQGVCTTNAGVVLCH